LDGHERHELHAETDLRMVCVFTPALTGQEVHDEDGAYPLLTEASRNGHHARA
jgi:L-ectoine synthase